MYCHTFDFVTCQGNVYLNDLFFFLSFRIYTDVGTEVTQTHETTYMNDVVQIWLIRCAYLEMLQGQGVPFYSVFL